MSIDGFTLGFVTGTILTVSIALVWNLYREWVKTRDSYHKPQVVIHTTSKTPEQVKQAADSAGLKIMLLQLTLFVGLWLLLEIGVPGFTRSIRQLFISIWNMAVSR